MIAGEARRRQAAIKVRQLRQYPTAAGADDPHRLGLPPHRAAAEDTGAA